MTRNKVQLQRITDDESRQAMFARRKQGLVKKAMELSVLCDCDVGLIIFGPGSSGPGTGGQRLYQYSSVSMDELLERYAAAVSEPHERRRTGELLRHYYELSPDEDGPDEGELHRVGASAPCTSAAAAEAAAMMAAVDSVILGGGGGGRRQDGSGGGAKRMRSISPLGLGGPGMSGGMAGGPGLGGGMGLVAGNGIPFLQHFPSTAASGMASLRRVPVVGGGSLGPPLPLEGIKAAGFLDKQKYPVSPRSERAYEAVTTQLDKLTELRSQRAGAAGAQAPTVLQPLASSAVGSLAAQQLQQFLQRQQQQQQQQLLLHQHANHHQHTAQPQLQGSGVKRFKPLSIMVPDIPAQPIIPTHLAPLTASTAGPKPPSSSALPPTTAANDCLTQHHPHHVPQQGLLPPPRPLNTRPLPGSNSAINLRHPQQATQARQPGVGPAAAAAASGHTSGDTANGGMGTSGAAAMDVDSSGAATPAGADEPLSVLLGSGPASSNSGSATLPPFRSSTDGSAANLLTMPSPPPLGGAAALFGSLDGGPLSIRSSSHGMLTALGMERGTSMGLGLESPGGLDAALRGLGPMDVLEWPSASPRSSSGVTEGTGAGSPGGFPDETEADGEGGTVMDGLVVRGTSLAKLAPEALVAAIGTSPDASAAGTSISARGRGGAASTSPSAFASPLTQQRLMKGLAEGQETGHTSAQQPGQVTPQPVPSAGSGSVVAGGGAGAQDGDASGRGVASGRYGIQSVGVSGALTVELSFNELGSAEPSAPGCIAGGEGSGQTAGRQVQGQPGDQTLGSETLQLGARPLTPPNAVSGSSEGDKGPATVTRAPASEG